jgi:hypothetical protein
MLRFLNQRGLRPTVGGSRKLRFAKSTIIHFVRRCFAIKAPLNAVYLSGRSSGPLDTSEEATNWDKTSNARITTLPVVFWKLMLSDRGQFPFWGMTI